MGILTPWAERGSPLYEEQLNGSLDPTTLTTVTAGGSAHTLGAWAQWVAATDYDVGMIGMAVAGSGVFTANTDTGMLLDIGIGAGGSEAVIIPQVNLGHAEANQGTWLFPIYIPKGSRIACRNQAVIASDTVQLYRPFLLPATAHLKPGLVCDTYGANAGASEGTTVTCGSGTWGAWAELSAATVRPARWATVSIGGQDNAFGSTVILYYQLGIGAAGSEEMIVPIVAQVVISTSELVAVVGRPPWPVDIPEGSRVAIRGWATSGTISDTGACVHLFS
jgi:hypothetical protein